MFYGSFEYFASDDCSGLSRRSVTGEGWCVVHLGALGMSLVVLLDCESLEVASYKVK